MPIYWVCESRDCVTGLSPREQRPHKSFKRKRAALDNGQLDEDDELVVFSELYGRRINCDDCGSLRRPVLSIQRFEWDDPPGNEDEWLFEISEAVHVYQRNGWYPRNQRRLF